MDSKNRTDNWEDDWENFEPYRIEGGGLQPGEDEIDLDVDMSVGDDTLVGEAIYRWRGERWRAKRAYGRWRLESLARDRDVESFFVLRDRRIIAEDGRFVGEIDDLGEPESVRSPRRRRPKKRRNSLPHPEPKARQRVRISDQMADLLAVLDAVTTLGMGDALRAVYRTERPTRSQRAAFSRTLRKMIDYGYVYTYSRLGEKTIRLRNDEIAERITRERVNR